MKKITTSLLCIMLFLNSFAQISTNTIVNDNSSWTILGEVALCSDCPVWTQYIYFDGDSIVEDYSYKKVFSCNDKLHEITKYEGLMREQDMKTYFIPAHSETEYLLYDFSLEEGTTFEHTGLSGSTVLLEVKFSDMVEINGVLKKRLQITYAPSSSTDYIIDTWIEDVGSLSGILHPCKWDFDGVINTLLCYYENNELIYKNPDYLECYYENNSVRTIEKNSCFIYPNPVDNILI